MELEATKRKRGYKFSSPMVNDYNLDTFVYGGDEIELAKRMIERKKPFASIVRSEENKADRTFMKNLHKKLKSYPYLVVSPLRAVTVHFKHSNQTRHRLTFEVAQTGTLDENFDMQALARLYKIQEEPDVAKDILRKRHLKISSYFDDWDWQDRCAKYRGSIFLSPWTKLRQPPLEPWETGLILGYPPEETLENYYNQWYFYQPDDPISTIKEYCNRPPPEGISYPTVEERRRSEKWSYTILAR